ncbi:hypothetical protein [Acidisphaera sp. L21]|uniref:hypothetical protein n=1 Tax=Acidisphaera sp. L21 TaxID=1641851 RepID=UPI00131A6F2D|nr:hypothetical protein [Acidisphaera sp. L21]
MRPHPSHSDETICAPAPFREALADLVAFGMRVARMVACAADAEAVLAEAAVAAGVAEGLSPIAGSFAEAIEADRAASAAAEARREIVGRAHAVAAAFSQVSRAVRRTVLLAERLDRGWARPGGIDDRHAMARRQIGRAVADAIARDADGETAEMLNGALRERLDSLDTLDDIGERPVEDIIRAICRDLGVDPAGLPGRRADGLAASQPVKTARSPGTDGGARASPIRSPPALRAKEHPS